MSESNKVCARCGAQHSEKEICPSCWARHDGTPGEEAADCPKCNYHGPFQVHRNQPPSYKLKCPRCGENIHIQLLKRGA